MSITDRNFSYFKQQASVYGRETYWRFDEQALVDRFFIKQHAKILVLGCGGGRTLLALHNHPRQFEISAIDIVPEMVAEASNRVHGTSIDVKCMDAASLEFPDQLFDYAFFPFHGIDYVTPHPEAAIAEASRVLKPDGLFVFSSHNRLFIKKLAHVCKSHADYEGVHTFRMWPWPSRYMKKYFHTVAVIARISLYPLSASNWKDKIYKVIPWLSKSLYFIANKPKNI